MYTPGQVSEMLDIPASTLRRYASDYADHLSEQAKKPGRSRRYTEQDLVYLARARKLLSAGNSPEQVNRFLLVTEDNELEHEENASLALIPGISQAIEAVNSQVRDIVSAIHELKDQQEITDSTQQDLIERIQALEHEAQRSWLDKILGKNKKRS